MSADQANPGKVWLSSQNRNFENSMGNGKVSLAIIVRLYLPHRIGSIGHLASAATVAASSFDMRLMDLHEFLASIDLKIWDELREVKPVQGDNEHDGVQYVEPCGPLDLPSLMQQGKAESGVIACHVSNQSTAEHIEPKIMTGQAERLGDFIDTHAVWSMQISGLNRPHAKIKSSLRRLSF